MEVVQGSTRPPRTPPKLAKRHHEQQGSRESRAKGVGVVYFDDWKLGYSIDRDPLIYIEAVVLSE